MLYPEALPNKAYEYEIYTRSTQPAMAVKYSDIILYKNNLFLMNMIFWYFKIRTTRSYSLLNKSEQLGTYKKWLFKDDSFFFNKFKADKYLLCVFITNGYKILKYIFPSRILCSQDSIIPLTIHGVFLGCYIVKMPYKSGKRLTINHKRCSAIALFILRANCSHNLVK